MRASTIGTLLVGATVLQYSAALPCGASSMPISRSTLTLQRRRELSGRTTSAQNSTTGVPEDLESGNADPGFGLDGGTSDASSSSSGSGSGSGSDVQSEFYAGLQQMVDAFQKLQEQHANGRLPPVPPPAGSAGADSSSGSRSGSSSSSSGAGSPSGSGSGGAGAGAGAGANTPSNSNSTFPTPVNKTPIFPPFDVGIGPVLEN